MKKNKIYLLVTIFSISCASSDKDCVDCEFQTNDSETLEVVAAATYTYDVDSAAFVDKLNDKSGLLIDVRTPEEYAAGFIDGAVNINYNDSNFEYEVDQISRETPLFVYCRSGGRSSKAMQKMNEMGFTEVYNLLGGYSQFMHLDEANH